MFLCHLVAVWRVHGRVDGPIHRTIFELLRLFFSTTVCGEQLVDGERSNDESEGDGFEGLLGYIWSLDVRALEGMVDEENLGKSCAFL